MAKYSASRTLGRQPQMRQALLREAGYTLKWFCQEGMTGWAAQSGYENPGKKLQEITVRTCTKTCTGKTGATTQEVRYCRISSALSAASFLCHCLIAIPSASFRSSASGHKPETKTAGVLHSATFLAFKASVSVFQAVAACCYTLLNLKTGNHATLTSPWPTLRVTGNFRK